MAVDGGDPVGVVHDLVIDVGPEFRGAPGVRELERVWGLHPLVEAEVADVAVARSAVT